MEEVSAIMGALVLSARRTRRDGATCYGLTVIYLDNNATTQPSPGVIQAVNEALTRFWHNPSSIHRPGQAARQQVELARSAVAQLVNARPREIVFTSGGTESIDLAIRGVLAGAPRADLPAIIVSTRIEHAAVRDLLEELEKVGAARIRWAPVDRAGVVQLEGFPALLEGASLVSIQWANNETGALQPVAEIAALCRAGKTPFHCDATQLVGKEPLDLGGSAPLPDIITFSPHKFHGPKGVGVFWSRRGLRLRPAIHGTQELGRRGGTENVPGILGAGVACEEARAWLAEPAERQRLAGLRDAFEQHLLSEIPDAQINGPGGPGARLWNTTNIGFPRLEAEALLLVLSERGVCASAGAACSSGSLDPSPVLLAMGCPPEVAHGSVRFSLSRQTTEDELDRAAAIVVECVRTLRRTLSITA
jgi:cysteine desulfurase